MKAIVISRFVQNYHEICVSQVPSPIPKHDEILIQVVAAGVNFVDTLYCRGLHQNNRRHVTPPFTLGLEFAGIVLSAPASCPHPKGSRVFGSCTGTYAEYITLHCSLADTLHLIPDSWSFVEAASLGATLPVSYGALKLRAAMKPGDTVLIHAAAGGLGLAAVQLARAMGCRVIGTAGSASKCSVAESFGADECINYTTNPRWWEHVNQLTNGQGADIVFDSVGLVGDSLRCLAYRGVVLVVGFAAREGDMEAVRMNRVLLGQATLIGYRFGESNRREPTETADIWKELLPLIHARKIGPTVYDGIYTGLESVPRALQDMASRQVWGKAVIRLTKTEAEAQKARL
ncbi:zeta-crystallin [Truncatella angustata]|uniref:Zeta-crystallin n=1 Tax=Truncatella angustata TaxID=152316 RepID=A0A9P8RJP7_9PEZI|nr:zeta-crystallin [Truncatella angustata]KAH6647298.1 zeta-crystallin [Truncatella angustata]